MCGGGDKGIYDEKIGIFFFFSLVVYIYTKVVIALLDISSLEGEAFNVALCEDDEQEIWFNILIFFSLTCVMLATIVGQLYNMYLLTVINCLSRLVVNY